MLHSDELQMAPIAKPSVTAVRRSTTTAPPIIITKTSSTAQKPGAEKTTVGAAAAAGGGGKTGQMASKSGDVSSGSNKSSKAERPIYQPKPLKQRSDEKKTDANAHDSVSAENEQLVG